MKGNRINDNERRLWVLNTEGLYNSYKHSRKGMQAFLKDNRATIDEHINKVLDQKPRS